MTPPPESTPPATVAPVACFATRWSDGRTLHAFVIEPGDPRAYEEYRALPVAAYTALMARIERMEAALAFYGDLDESGNVHRFDESNYTGDPDDVTYDRGAKARAALGREGA